MNEQEFNSLPISQRKAAQQRLIDAGLYSGKPDGTWGPGTKAAFDNEDKRRVEDEKRNRVADEAKQERDRQTKIEETRTKADAAEKEAKAEATRQATADTKAKAERKAQYDEDAASGLGMAAKFGANIASPAVAGVAGWGSGKGINAGLNLGQEFMNKKLQGVAADRVAGLTTRDAAQNAVRLSGAMPIDNRVGRVASRLLPHIGLGGLGIGKGAQILHDSDPDQPYYAYQADRAAGLGYIGAGAGIMKAGIGHASNPKVTPDSQALAIINSPQLRRNGAAGGPTVEDAAALSRGPLKTLDLEALPDTPTTKALPAPEEDAAASLAPKRQHSDRLMSAAKVARNAGIEGAPGDIGKKSGAAEYLNSLDLDTLDSTVRSAMAKELGVKPGANFSGRMKTAIANMARRPGSSSILGPALAAGTAFLATPKRAEAGTGSEVTGADEALTNAGAAGALGYGFSKLLKAAPMAGEMMAPISAMQIDPLEGADLEDTRHKIADARASMPGPVRRLLGVTPEEMAAHDKAQVPAANPARIERAATDRQASEYLRRYLSGEPTNMPDGGRQWDDTSIDNALSVARRATGGRVTGGLHHDGGGRTDDIPLEVERGTYIIPADIVSALGQGNTLAGIKVLDNMFPPQSAHQSKGGKDGRPNHVPIVAAGGEFQISPQHVAMIGNGDVKHGADVLDAFIQDVRQQHIDTLQQLPGPAQ